MKNEKGFAPIIILYAALALGGGLYLFKPKLFSAESRRAAASQKATAKVETTTTAVDHAVDNRSAAAAAYVSKIGEANLTSPDSKQKDFIGAAVPIALSFLPAPDPQKLLEVEKLKNAFLQGQVELSSQLANKALADSATLKDQLNKALIARDKAEKARIAADEAISEAAAEHLAQEHQKMLLIAVVVLIGGLWVYAKIYSITPASLGKIAADIRSGVNPIQALDTNLAPWMHNKVAVAAQLATPLDKPPTP